MGLIKPVCLAGHKLAGHKLERRTQVGKPSAVPRFVKVLLAVLGGAFFVVVVLAVAGAAWYGLSKKHTRTVDSASADPASAGTFAAENSEGDGQGSRRHSGSAAQPPMKVQPFRGQYCSSLGPPGWAVIAENPQRSAFGADFASSDGMVFAGYSIFPAGRWRRKDLKLPDAPWRPR